MRLFIAYLKKKLGILSPSALFNSEGKIKYEYDWLKEVKNEKNRC